MKINADHGDVQYVDDPGRLHVVPQTSHIDSGLTRGRTANYSVRNAIVGSMLSARRVGTRQPNMHTPSMTIP